MKKPAENRRETKENVVDNGQSGRRQAMTHAKGGGYVIQSKAEQLIERLYEKL